jgi:lysozyme
VVAIVAVVATIAVLNSNIPINPPGDGYLGLPGPNPPRIWPSNQGIEFIKGWEHFRPVYYNDSANPPNCTIGYGYLIHTGPCQVGMEGRWESGITEAEAAELVWEKVREFVPAISQAVHVPLWQHQFDALMDFTYNIGPANFERSILLQYLNRRQYWLASQGFFGWMRGGPGIATRRRAESRLFQIGVYDSSH